MVAAAGNGWDQVMRVAGDDGSALHPHVQRLSTSHASSRDLADAVHAIAAVHAHRPGIAAIALSGAVHMEAHDWLERVSRAMMAERTMLVELAAAVGPLPSTPGQAASAAAIVSSRHALETLAKSERKGCASGAIAALVHDWRAVRGVAEQAALRVGYSVALPTFPPLVETAATLATLGRAAPVERAIGFGAQQLFHQHRMLWDLLETRAGARIR